MIQEEIVEDRAFHLKSSGLAGEPAVLENQLQTFRGIAQMKLGAKLDREPRGFEFGQNPHVLKELAIVRQ